MNELGKEFVLDHGNIPLSHVEEVVAHYAEGYNPVKAREYYLKTRKLKGRTAGIKPVAKGRSLGSKKPVASGIKNPAQHRKETQAKVAALKLRLETLRVVLVKLTEQSKASGGMDFPLERRINDVLDRLAATRDSLKRSETSARIAVARDSLKKSETSARKEASKPTAAKGRRS